MTMLCLPCNKDVQPYIDLGEKGEPLHICPTCNIPIARAKADRAPPRSTQQPATTQQLPEEPAPMQPPAPAGAPLPAVGVVRPIDPVAQLRMRLVTVEAELQRFDGLQSEARMLRAMIKAAERMQRPKRARRRADEATLPLPNVVPIKSAGAGAE